jgi:hypothetical protein
MAFIWSAKVDYTGCDDGATYLRAVCEFLALGVLLGAELTASPPPTGTESHERKQ